MKKLFIASGLIVLLLLPICSSISLAGGKKDLAPLEPAAITDFDFVVLTKNSSTSVTADIAFPLAFEFIPVLLVGDANTTGTFASSMTRNTTGEIIYIYQRFLGGPAAFNIGITPVSIRISTAVTLGPGYAIGWVITGILFSPEKPPYEYTVPLSF